jgi:hypothetical protein
MTKILIVEKLGSIKETIAKELVIGDLYKKAGFKVATGFELQTTFVHPRDAAVSVELYGKTSGRAGQENKYDFPPPVDNTLFFGNCVLVGKHCGNTVDLSKGIWEKIYEALFGGFEDIGAGSDSDSDSEAAEEAKIMSDPNTKLTKQGYVKDDFIVDDDDYEEDDEGVTSEEEEVVVKSKKKANGAAKGKTSAKGGTTRKPATKKTEKAQVSEPYTCVEELSEEEYFA